ncbi:MAG TPA: helix-hairpin-helix domain-containing protein [Chthoniobacterales bacterium]|jgi:competence protein ComEA
MTFKRLLLLCILLSLGATARAAQHWITYENCRLLPNPANDGDSFHVRAHGKEYIFRLYFVDAPETDASFPERVAEQAKYFHVTSPRALQIGEAAERYVQQKLDRPFAVETCKEDARGRSHLPRYFALVEIGQEDLAEDLVSNGLARVYGEKAHPPDRATPAAEWRKLRRLERNAKAQKVGAWGLDSGRLNVRATASPGVTSESFEAFFHPQARTATASPIAPAAALAAISSDAKSSPARGKLDINTATSATLDHLPGVGQVLAGRIIAARPFQSADELQRVSGIGPKKYAKLRPYFQ